MRTSNKLWMVLVILDLGCGRFGFEVSPGDAGRSGDAAMAEQDGTGGDGTVSAFVLDRQHDCCADPLVLDMSRAPFAVTIDSTGARNDLGIPACKGWPELVVELRNFDGSGSARCQGQGSLIIAWSSSQSCTAPTMILSKTVNCTAQASGSTSSWSSSWSSSLKPRYWYICRDPTAGPAVVTIN